MTGSYFMQNSVVRSALYFLGNEFLLGCNHSLENSLLHYELECLGQVGVRWWWFRVEWEILISFIKMNWCRYSLVYNSFVRLSSRALDNSRTPRLHTVDAMTRRYKQLVHTATRVASAGGSAFLFTVHLCFEENQDSSIIAHECSKGMQK